MAIDLIFSSPPASSGALVFGGDTDAPVSTNASVSFSGVLGDLSGTVILRAVVDSLGFSGSLGDFAGDVPLVQIRPAVLGFTGALGDFAGALGLAYDNQVTPWMDSRIMASHQTAIPARRSLDTAWQVASAGLRVAEPHWTPALPVELQLSAGFFTSLPVRLTPDARWTLADRIEVQTAAVHEQSVEQRLRVAAAWEEAQRKDNDTVLGLQTGIFNMQHRLGAWQVGGPLAVDAERRLGASQFRTGIHAHAMPWQMAGQAQNGRSVLPVIPVVIPVYTPSGTLLFECPPLVAANLVFGAQACYLPPVTPGTVVVPVRKVYLVINNASLRRVDGNIQLPVFNMSLALDVDSWTWSFGAALPGVALPDLEPSESGAPVEVEAMINGVAYRALVERIGRERSFGKSDLRVSGRGKTALLDSPYAPAKNFLNSGARTAQQIMGDVLSVNGVAMDWTLDWQLDDWLVPDGVFAHQGSYISALNVIAAAAGGYVQPHASLQTLHILPRYPVATWAWDSVTPDFSLPSDVTTRESIEWVERARYNRVFVSGQQSGILGQVTRSGTAGDLLAPMVTDALITTAAVARQRGISILANTGRQAEISLRLPVLAETGVITPGKFVQYTDAGVSRVGIVRSTGVEVGMPEIWQTLGVQTYA